MRNQTTTPASSAATTTRTSAGDALIVVLCLLVCFFLAARRGLCGYHEADMRARSGVHFTGGSSIDALCCHSYSYASSHRISPWTPQFSVLVHNECTLLPVTFLRDANENQATTAT